MKSGTHHSSKRTKRKGESGPLLPDYKTPAVELFKKPYSEWSKKQREWLDVVYKRLFRSPRGRKRETAYDDLFREREMARLTRSKVPSYTEQATTIPGLIDLHYKRQELIRAFQRRKKALRLPDPPKE